MTTVVQVAHARAASTSVAATLNGVVSGHPILIIVNGESSSAFSISSVTDSNGTIYTAHTLSTVTDGSDIFGIGVYLVQSAASGTHTITATFSISVNATIEIAELSTSGTPSLDVDGALTHGLSATPTTGSITPINNGDLIIAAVNLAISASTISAWTNSFTQGDVYTAAIPTASWAYLDQTTAAAISTGCTSGASAHWGAQIVSLTLSGSTPTISSVNSGANIAEGATNVAVVGTGFLAGMTSNILQPGSVSVAQATTFVSATSATFNLSMEPAGNQLAFTDATYTTTYTVTDTNGTSAPVSIPLVPPAGLIFQTLASINGTSAYDITAIPGLVAGDQLEASGNITGTTAAPTGLTLNNDATFSFSAGNTPVNFFVRAYDGTGKTWGAWAMQSVAAVAGDQGLSALGFGMIHLGGMVPS